MLRELERILGRELGQRERQVVSDYIREYEDFRGSLPDVDTILFAVFARQRGANGELEAVEGGGGYVAPDESELRAEERLQIERLQQRTDIRAGLERDPSEPVPQAQATPEQLEARLGVTFRRDANGDVVEDADGNYVMVGVDPQFGLPMAINPDTGQRLPAIGVEEEERDPLIGGFNEGEVFRDLRFEGEEDLIARLDPQARRSLEETIQKEWNLSDEGYRQWDQWRNFATKSSEYQTQVQRKLVDAGLLDERNFVAGVWTFEAARAMEAAMMESNATGGSQTWVDILDQRARGQATDTGDDDGTGGPLSRRMTALPAYREPDYASLSQNVKNLFRNQLGREPVDWEVALLADRINEDYRRAYDAESAALRSEFEAGNRAILLSEDSDDPVITSAGTVQQVDPVARLRERFEEKYGPELELNRDRIAERQQLGGVFDILTQTSRLMGGGVR